jgi:hypothetical protein
MSYRAGGCALIPNSGNYWHRQRLPVEELP